MASITIRNLPNGVRDKLRVRAAMRGLSMEAEARAILSSAVGLTLAEAEPETSQALQDWVAAKSQPVPDGVVATDQNRASFIADKRREAILEVLSDGLDPALVFGANFARILTEAGWTRSHVRKLRSKAP